MGVNLHNVVRSIIETLHEDEDLLLYQSIGQVNVRGRIKARYNPPVSVRGQVQNTNDAGLQPSNELSVNTDMRRVYLYADEDLPPRGIDRPLTRTGDMLKRTDGRWLYVTGVQDDFSRVGWVCVSCVLQSIGVSDDDIVSTEEESDDDTE